jgi:threonyl-tRNA synthetase
VKILPISDKSQAYAEKVAELLKKADIRAEIDERSEKIGKKIREAELAKIPYMLVLGEKEAADEVVAVRRQSKGDLGTMNVDAFIKLVSDEVANKKPIE